MSSGNCVEVGTAGQAVTVRDSKNPGGQVLTFAAATWKAFAEQLKTAA